MENDDTLWPPLTNGKGRKEKKKKTFLYCCFLQIKFVGDFHNLNIFCNFVAVSTYSNLSAAWSSG